MFVAEGYILSRDTSHAGAVTGSPWKYVFDVTSIGQHSSPWTHKLSERRDTFHLECKLHFATNAFSECI